jgi:transposase
VRLRVSKTERARLEEICRHQRGEARLYRRARIVLLALAGESVRSIARQLGTNRTRVTEWLRRFRERRVDGLDDIERPGRPIIITPLERH